MTANQDSQPLAETARTSALRRINQPVLWLGLIVVTGVIAFLALGFRFDPREIKSPLIGKTAPTFSLTALDGQEFDLAELRGKPVVLNFWSTWCAPCIQEHPLLEAAAEHYGDEVQFLGVIYQDDIAKIESFLQRAGAWGPALVDPGGRTALAYGVYGPPETFLIDRNGVIVDKVIGAVTGQYLKATLDALR